MKIQFIKADPSGNITLFVLTPVAREERARIAARLMSLPELDAEQVGFITKPLHGAAGRMEMMGGEFCGNATRSFGMLLARDAGRPGRITVEVSGCPDPVPVTIDWEKGTAMAQMPLPVSIETVEVRGVKSVLVDLGGIAHLVAENVSPDTEFFRAAEPLLAARPEADAYGVIFVDLNTASLIPLVKVPATGTLVWESSCGSGALAAACAAGARRKEGEITQRLYQPAGIISATVKIENGVIREASIGGPVTLGPVQEVSV